MAAPRTKIARVATYFIEGGIADLMGLLQIQELLCVARMFLVLYDPWILHYLIFKLFVLCCDFLNFWFLAFIFLLIFLFTITQNCLTTLRHVVFQSCESCSSNVYGFSMPWDIEDQKCKKKSLSEVSQIICSILTLFTKILEIFYQNKLSSCYYWHRLAPLLRF